MSIIQVYKCLCDEQRLRILNLLKEGPLCVCHLQELLGEGQVKISKQLRYMKELGMVEARREANWMIYSLPQPTNPLLIENLQCLQDCAAEDLHFANDLKERAKLLKAAQHSEGGLPESVACGAGCCE